MKVNKGVFRMGQSISKVVRKYTAEFKQEAVNFALKSGCVNKTAKELGIPSPTLHSWVKALKDRSNPSVVDADTGKDLKTLIEENRRLHKELAIAKEEKEILKKAATYFAQHQK